jgi:hypothetical protein
MRSTETEVKIITGLIIIVVSAVGFHLGVGLCGRVSSEVAHSPTLSAGTFLVLGSGVGFVAGLVVITAALQRRGK